MNFILSGADGVGDWLWRTSWQSAVLALLVLVTQGLFRQHLTPAWRYRLWLLVVLRLVLPISPESSTSVFNLARLRPALPMTPLVRPTAAAPSPVDLSAPVIAPRKGASPTAIAIPIASTVLPPAERQIASRAEAPSSLRPAPSTGSRLYACLPWMWALGVAWLIGRTAWQVVRFGRRLRTEATPASAEVERQFAQCREQLSVRQRVTLVETSLVSSPALYGLFRVRLLLPVGLTARFSADELRYVLLHELAHLKRQDLAMNWVLALLQALHWFNPVLWLAFARVRVDRELACDALALTCARDGESTRYGETIIRLLEGMSRPAAVPGMVGVLESREQIRERIRMIAAFRRPGRWSALASLFVLGLGVVGLTDAPSGRKPVELTAETEASSRPGNDRDRPDPAPGKATAPHPGPNAPEVSAVTSSDGRINGTVLLDGQPVPHASLVLQRRAAPYDPRDFRDMGSARTDAVGRTYFYPTTDAARLCAWTADGFAIADTAELTNEFRLELKRFGTVEGRLRRRSEPLVDETVVVEPASGDAPACPWVDIRPVRTDVQGRFVIHQVPPGQWRLWRLETNVRCCSHISIPGAPILEVKSAQTARVDYEVAGRTVTGRAVVDDPSRKVVWRATNSRYALCSALPKPLDASATEAERSAWETRYGEALRTLQIYHVEMAEDGSFRIDDVQPGAYRLEFDVYGEPAAGTVGPLRHQIAEWLHEVSIPAADATAAESPVDLGTVVVNLRPSPKVGDRAPAWKGTTLDGSAMRSEAFSGRPVLLVFWNLNPYCPPETRTELPKVQALLDEFGKDRLGAVGIVPNVGGGAASEVRPFVEAHRITWPQVVLDATNGLRTFSDFDAGVGPAFVLVGANGEVRARHWSVDGIKPALEAALR